MAYIRELTDDKVVAEFYLGARTDGTPVRQSKTFYRPSEVSKSRWKKVHLTTVALYEEQLKGQTEIRDYKLDAYCKLWLEDYAKYNLAPSTVISYKGQIDNIIIPSLGHLALDKVTPVRISRMLNKLVDKSDRTIKYPLQVLSSILGYAVKMGDLEDNPCKKVTLPKSQKEEKDKRKFLEIDEIARLIKLVDKEPLKYQAIFYLALAGGLRRSEILNLRFSDIDGDTIKVPGTKSKASKREITLDKASMKIIKAHLRDQELLSKALGWDDYLFTQNNGARMHLGTPSSWLKKLIIESGDNIPVITLHALRHTSATIQVSKGIDIKTVSARLGHSDTSMTLRTYTHMLKDKEEEAANIVGDFLEKVK